MVDRLDAALSDLAPQIAFPPTPDLRPFIAARLAEPRRRSWWPSAWQRALLLAVLAALLLAATAAAVALVLPGLRITVLPTLPSPSTPADALATRLALGTRVPVDTVDAGVPGVLGEPDEVYVSADGEVVSLVYAERDDLSALAGTGIGLLVQEISGSLDRERIEKLIVEVGATVTSVEVGGAEGYWIEGPAHLMRYTGPSGQEREQMTRLVGDTLVWEREGVLHRIESGLGLEETRRIAESINR